MNVGRGEPLSSEGPKTALDLKHSASQTWRLATCDRCDELVQTMHSKDYKQFLEFRAQNGFFLSRQSLGEIEVKLESLRKLAHDNFAADQTAATEIMKLKLTNTKLQSLFDDVARKNLAATHCIKSLKTIILKLDAELKEVTVDDYNKTLTTVEKQWVDKIAEESTVTHDPTTSALSTDSL